MTNRERQIRRLLRWYPKQWQENHVDEFSALLEDSISERSFWPRRGLDIAIQGSKLRLRALGTRFAGVWFQLSFAIFVIYGVLFATVSIPNASHGNFRGLFQLLDIVLAGVLIGAGLITLAMGARIIRSTQSIRRGWPYMSLGFSLMALIGLDGWVTRGTTFWGEVAFSQAVWSLYPTSLRHELSHPFGLVWYLPVNLLLIILMGASAIAIRRRTGRRLTHGAPVVDLGIALLMSSTAAVSWTWAIEVTGPLPDRYFIPWVITLAGVSALLARLHGRRAFIQKHGDVHI